MMTRLIPKIFYARMNDGLDLFVSCLSLSATAQRLTSCRMQSLQQKSDQKSRLKPTPSTRCMLRFHLSVLKCFIRIRKPFKKNLGAQKSLRQIQNTCLCGFPSTVNQAGHRGCVRSAYRHHCHHPQPHQTEQKHQ